MSRIVYFVENIAPGLYLLCALGVLLSARLLMLSRGELRIAEFELEREIARRRQAAAITRTLGLIEVILAVYAIANVVAPTLRNDVLPGNPAANAGPTSGPFYTSTPGGSGGNIAIEAMMASVTAARLNNDAGPAILVTPTISPTPVGTIIPDVPKPLGCDTPDATLEVPANGQVIFDSLTVIGTAKTSNFSLYKFELNGPSTGNSFTPYGGDRTSPVVNKGTLGQLALGAFQPGTYQFRLAVFDNTNALKASCTVTVELRVRPPTATPPGGKSP